MRALLKKELTEVLVPFGSAFAVIVIAWLVSVRFWDALLPPADEMLQIVGLSSALTGAVLGYLQFSSERWRGKLGYLCHRGTGVDGAILAKMIAGLLGTTLVGLGPPILYALSAKLFSPNASIIQASLLPAYVSVATAGASLYGLGALAASLRRRAVLGILLILLGGCALWAISEMCGTPWGNASSAWLFPALHLGLATVLLLLVHRLGRSGVDPDLPLPRGVHLAVVVLAVPLVLFPCDIGASLLQSSLLSEVRSEYPMLVRDRESGEIFPVVSGEGGGHFRLEPDGRIGERVEFRGSSDPESGFDTVFWGLFGASAAEPPTDRPMLVRERAFGTRRGLMPVGVQYKYFAYETVHDWGNLPNVRVYLDLERGTVRAFAFVVDPNQRAAADGLRPAPFAIELEKPQGGRSFSPETFVLRGEDGAVIRLVEENASGDAARPKPKIKLFTALVDPEDGSFWRLDVLDPDAPLARVQLPGDDRFVRLESLYRRNELVFGRYQDPWEDPVVVGERGRYAWNGREFVGFVPSEQYATASEAESLFRFRVIVDDPDPLRWTVRVLDAKDGRELFTHAYAPRTGAGALTAAAAEATVLLRSMLANSLVFTGMVREESAPELSLQVRPGLWLLDLAIALGCAGVCVRMLRRRSVPAIWIGLWCAFVLLFGPVALLVVWLLEPRGRARELPVAQAVHEPVLTIQSA